MNRRNFIKAVGVGASSLLLSPKFSLSTEISIVDKFILIIWDGCERTRIKKLMVDGYLPNLASLISKGSIIELDAGSRTCTKPCHSSILTGCGPITTGVWENTMWQQVPSNLSILERLHDHFGDSFNEFWTSGKEHQVGSDPTKVFYNVARYCMRRDEDFDRPANETGAKAVKWVNNHKTNSGFWFIHFREPDYIGHVYGEHSDEYTQEIINLDYWLGEIVNVATSDTAIMVLTDHGFDIEGFHKLNKKNELRYAHFYAPKAWAASNKFLARSGNLFDIAPTIYELFGIDSREFFPPLLGSSLLHEKSNWNLNEESSRGYNIDEEV